MSARASESTKTPIETAAALYHDWLTGLILHVISRCGPEDAEDLVFRLFRRKHLEQFLPGLEKLGLLELPPAVACAQYHYLSNQLGGVKVEYAYESDQKAWVRYPPPRWIWQGTAVAGVPGEVSAAMLRGWHAHNGPSLGCPRLGFVCTKQTVDGLPGLEGYYREADRELTAEERLVFRYEEEMPPFDAASAPRVPSAEWPAERLAKAGRNYAMDYMATALVVLCEQFGEERGSELGGMSARLIAMHWLDEAFVEKSSAQPSLEGFAAFFEGIQRAQNDEVVIREHNGSLEIEQRGWRLMRQVPEVTDRQFRAWNELWIGALGAYDRFQVWEVLDCELAGDQSVFRWRLSRR